MRRVVQKSGVRRTVAGAQAAVESLPLDNQPLALVRMRDGKRLVVVMPYELWLVDGATLTLEKAIDLPLAHPSVSESEEDGIVWIGGHHLHRGNLFAGSASKVGTKLAGFVDRVCLIRPNTLCAVGQNGELLWDTAKSTELHRRKVSERPVLGLVASADGRAVWTEGRGHAWIIDPDHTSGYTKLHLKTTSPGEHPAEAIVELGRTHDGRVILAAADGAIGWTNRALRFESERFPRTSDEHREPLALAGNERWIYVLRAGGVLQRFLVAQPKPPPGSKDEPEPLPDAQTVELRQEATAIAVLPGDKLVLAGPQAERELGLLWHEDAEALAWEPLALGTRSVQEAPPEPTSAGPKVPNFERVRNKVTGPPLRELRVDDVLSGPGFWVTRDHGALLDRPTMTLAAEQLMPADALVLPAMIRLHEGTARPGLLVWPGRASGRQSMDPIMLTWGDDPRGWIPLDTPDIRAQGWTRRDVFPLQVALRTPAPNAPGTRQRLPQRWNDSEMFEALAKECKRLLKVVW